MDLAGLLFKKAGIFLLLHADYINFAVNNAQFCLPDMLHITRCRYEKERGEKKKYNNYSG